jgi:hypothetical protein
MDTQQAYVARLNAQVLAVNARLDQMDAQARARNAKADMDEISGLRARRDKIQQQVTSLKSRAQDDWDAFRRRIDESWSDLRRDVTERHSRLVAWDDARERRFVAHLDEAEARLRESAATDDKVAADLRIEIGESQRELRDKALAARESYDAWRAKKKAESLQRKLDDAEFELDGASNRYVAALDDISRHQSESRP